MMNFLDKIDNKTKYEGVNFFNIENNYISTFFNELSKLINTKYLVITSVDGSVNNQLMKVLALQNAHFEILNEICLLYPESVPKFIEYIKNIPECSFYCCHEKPSEINLDNISTGYIEIFGKIVKNSKILKRLCLEMKTIASSLYVSQGDCNLFIGLIE
jgi:hypothetical protein